MEIFIKVSYIGHLTRVASEIGLSQSAISMSIKELESIIGYKLFDRLQKKLILNERGRAFLEEVEPLIKKLNDIERDFQTSLNAGHIVIGASTTIADYLAPQIISEYMDSYKDVKISLRIGNTEEIVHMATSGEIDFGLIEGHIESSFLVQEVVGIDNLTVVTADKQIASKKEYFIDTLLEKKWILREKGSGTRDIFLRKIKKHIPNLNIFLELAHTESIKSALSFDDTISCLSKISVAREIENKELFEVKLKGFEFCREFYLVTHKDKHKSELFKKFNIFLKKKLGEKLGAKEC
jgi:DNA-binding transcriptional LysR family regulator